ncbi:MAG: hypothetical protein HY287_10255 [Planctomycetes bacterium]|nr:hypothetical protein [Planctomycetota bacterium]MBI3834698.1 hypothetical protein [Planctomycetota bacterium]
MSDVKSGESISGASLEFARASKAAELPNKADASRKLYWHKPTFTDNDGGASIDTENNMIVGGPFPLCLIPTIVAEIRLHRDWVTGDAFAFRIKNERGEETIDAQPNVGEHTDGKSYRLTFLEISKPHLHKGK